MRRWLILVAGCVAAVGLIAAMGAVAASAGRPAAAPAAEPPAVTAAPAAAGHPAGGAHHGGAGKLELYAVQTGKLGTVVTDGQGRLLYGSDGDANDPPASHCTGPCAQRWLPLVVPPGQEPDLLGVDADTVGRVARDDGSSQLTIGGWPVYVNRSDDGELKAPATDGPGWFAVTPQGAKVPL